MHLLQAGLPPITIKDILGHKDIKSTDIYVETNLEMRRKALELRRHSLPNQKERQTSTTRSAHMVGVPVTLLNETAPRWLRGAAERVRSIAFL